MSIEANHITLGNMSIDVIQKDIRNIHLSVYPPSGKVRIAAPLHLDIDTIRVYAISKLSWIKKQQQRFQKQERETPRDYINLESHYYKGKRYLLKVIESDTTPKVILKHKTIELYVRSETNRKKKQTILDEWYRENLKLTIPKYIQKWEKQMGVLVNEFSVKKMKTKWGTCNREEKRIWLNLELAKKHPHCLEYIIVHEMVHLLERNHNDRFINHLNNFLPDWRHLKEELNRMPVSHQEWKY